MGGLFKPAFPRVQWGDPLARGLQLAWQCSEGSGSVLQDLSGNGNHGDFIVGSPDWRAGRAGWSLHLPKTPWVRSRKNIAIGTQFSIALWVLPIGSTTGFARIIETDWFTAWGLALSSDGTTGYNWAVRGADPDSGTLTFGKWTHLCGTYAGGTMKFYQDGVLQNSSPGGSNTPATSLLVFLNWRPSFALQWDFACDDIRVYDRELARDEINRLIAQTGKP